jgi:hypothetical protein
MCWLQTPLVVRCLPHGSVAGDRAGVVLGVHGDKAKGLTRRFGTMNSLWVCHKMPLHIGVWVNQSIARSPYGTILGLLSPIDSIKTASVLAIGNR